MIRIRQICRSARVAAVCAGAVVFAACGDDEPKAARPSVATSTPVARPPSPADSLCPRDGSWRACHLEDRINKSGMGIKVVDTVTVPYFAERGTRYRIGKTARLVAFFFADSAAGAKATAELDRFYLTPRGDTLGVWPSRPSEVIRSANLIAVLFDVNATQAERVRLALTAGAPQPAMEPAEPKAQMLPPAKAR